MQNSLQLKEMLTDLALLIIKTRGPNKKQWKEENPTMWQNKMVLLKQLCITFGESKQKKNIQSDQASGRKTQSLGHCSFLERMQNHAFLHCNKYTNCSYDKTFLVAKHFSFLKRSLNEWSGFNLRCVLLSAASRETDRGGHLCHV